MRCSAWTRARLFKTRGLKDFAGKSQTGRRERHAMKMSMTLVGELTSKRRYCGT